MSSDVAIKVEDLGKCYQIYDKPQHRLLQMLVRNHRKFFRDFWALKNVSFEVPRGDTVGIVGRNGSGKSTLLQLICGTLSPTCGSVAMTGRVAALLELGSGFNPEFTGRENIYMNAAVLGLTRQEADERYEDIVAFADIGDFIDQPVKTYSSGMVVRVAFSVAINVNPAVLVVDEALSVGDAAFQRKCMRRLEELSDSGVTLLFVSHDTEAVRTLCSSAIYLTHGEIKCKGGAKDVCIEYERDLFGASKRGVATGNKTRGAEETIDNSTLDPELLNSSEKVYGDGRIEIREIAVTDLNQRRINVLPVGTRFVVSYVAEFRAHVPRPIFGIMLTTKEGVCVFGTNTTDIDVSRRSYISGDRVRMKFILRNYLGPGIYYLTCGVHSTDNEDGLIYHQRRMDSLILKSLGRDGEMASGTAHLLPAVEATIEDGVLKEVASS